MTLSLPLSVQIRRDRPPLNLILAICRMRSQSRFPSAIAEPCLWWYSLETIDVHILWRPSGWQMT